MSKLSFKREPRTTGLAACAAGEPATAIKRNGREVGSIAPPSRFGSQVWRVRLVVKDDNEHCGWRWVTLKFQPRDEQEAREWLKSLWPVIENKFDLYELENEQ